MGESTKEKLFRYIIAYATNLTSDYAIGCHINREGDTLTIQLEEPTIDTLATALSDYDLVESYSDVWPERQCDAAEKIIRIVRTLVEDSKND